MKLRTLFICGCLVASNAPFLFAAKMHGPAQHESNVPAGPKIRILLEKDTPSAFLEARGRYRVVRKDTGTSLSQGAIGKRFVVHALQDGLRWGEEYPDIYQISLLPLSEETFFYVNGIQCKGAISIYHVHDNHIAIVNEIPIEDYLKSTLAVQYDSRLGREAMSAMVIIARTEAYKRAQSGKTTTRPWDITAEEASYFGYGVSSRLNGVDEAVDWSRFMVMESVKQGGLAPSIHLDSARASELALKGLDAQQILKSVFPHLKIGATIKPDEVALR